MLIALCLHFTTWHNELNANRNSLPYLGEIIIIIAILGHFLSLAQTRLNSATDLCRMNRKSVSRSEVWTEWGGLWSDGLRPRKRARKEWNKFHLFYFFSVVLRIINFNSTENGKRFAKNILRPAMYDAQCFDLTAEYAVYIVLTFYPRFARLFYETNVA